MQSYIALYRKWRPSVFEDVVEQEHVVKTLRYSVSSGRIAHAYLFCGTRGTGKTTMAHILSRAINCLAPNNGDPCNKCEICTEILSGNSMDVIEMDAASNNSVDNVREIRDEVIYAASRARYKVYIIDEVHMLSTGAFNALLKTLEEPPAHVVFILATTEPHKLPATILSRCQRFDFRRISVESIVGRLTEIASTIDITIEKEAARLIAKKSDGALRDAISLLDQCISLGRSVISYNDVLSVIGIVNDTFFTAFADHILKRDVNGILTWVDKLVMDGKDIAHFISDLVHYFRNLLICKVAVKPEDILDLPAETINIIREQCKKTSQEEIINIIKELSSLESGLKWVTNPRIMLEVTLMKLIENKAVNTDSNITVNTESNILERLEALEKKLDGSVVQTTVVQPHVQSINNTEFKPAPAPTHEPSFAPAPSPAPEDSVRKQINVMEPAPVTPAAAQPVKTEYMPEWQKIMDVLRNMGKRALHSYLLETRAVRLADNLVGVIFNEGNKVCKSVVAKAEHLEVLEETATKVLGAQVKIKCLDEGEAANGHIKKNSKSEVKDEFVEKVRSIAEIAGIPLEIFDE